MSPQLSLAEMMRILHCLENDNRWFFTLHNISIFTGRKIDKSLTNDLQYYVDADLIEYIGEGVYAFRISSMIPFNAQENIARALRPCCVSYLSFEYILNEYGIISQIPTIMTVATTGKTGKYTSHSYNIEFTHVDHNAEEIFFNCTYSSTRKILVASPIFAVHDLEYANRNTHLIDYDEIDEAQKYYENINTQ